MCHEAVPGHNMQGDIQVRQSGGPKFRAVTGYVAFGEGWGLYAERMCAEMNVFPDIAADFFRLDAELFRAARLVVDTGIHWHDWSRERAIAYMQTHLALDEAMIAARWIATRRCRARRWPTRSAT